MNRTIEIKWLSCKRPYFFSPSFIFIGLLTVMFSCAGAGSNRGREFILGFLENRYIADDAIIRILVTSASENNVTVRISAPRETNITGHRLSMYDVIVTLQPRTSEEVTLPHDLHMTGMEYGHKGIYVKADGDITVQGGSINDKSSEAYLALSKPTLGTEYVVACYIFTGPSDNHQGPTQFGIVSVYALTNVTVSFPDGIDVNLVNQLGTGRAIRIGPSSYSIAMLKPFDTFQVTGWGLMDLTGTRISSNRPVAVFSGARWSSVGTEYQGDHMIEQLPPVQSWGTEFYTMPIATKTAGDVFRIIPSTNRTTLYMDGDIFGSPSWGLGHVDVELESDKSHHIMASDPVLLIQLCKGYDADGVLYSDPYMSITPSVEQYTNDYYFSTFTAMSPEDPYVVHVSVVSLRPQDIFLDDAPISDLVNSTITPLGSEYKIQHFYVQEPGYHRLRSQTGNTMFGAMLYGMRPQEGYGHPLGHALVTNSYRCTDPVDNDCDGQINEELPNGIDDDGDGYIDEDLSTDDVTVTSFPPTQQEAGLTTVSRQGTPTSVPEGDNENEVETRQTSTIIHDDATRVLPEQRDNESLTTQSNGGIGATSGTSGLTTTALVKQITTNPLTTATMRDTTVGGIIQTGKTVDKFISTLYHTNYKVATTEIVDNQSTANTMMETTSISISKSESPSVGFSTSSSSATMTDSLIVSTTLAPSTEVFTKATTNVHEGEGHIEGRGRTTPGSDSGGEGEAGKGTSIPYATTHAPSNLQMSSTISWPFTTQSIILSTLTIINEEDKGGTATSSDEQQGGATAGTQSSTVTAVNPIQTTEMTSVDPALANDCKSGDICQEIIYATSLGRIASSMSATSSAGRSEEGAEDFTTLADNDGEADHGKTSPADFRSDITTSYDVTIDNFTQYDYNVSTPSSNVPAYNTLSSNTHNDTGSGVMISTPMSQNDDVVTAGPQKRPLEDRIIVAIIIAGCILLGIPTLWCCCQCMGPTCSAACAKRKKSRAAVGSETGSHGSQEAILPSKFLKQPSKATKSLTYSAFTPDVTISLMDQASKPNGCDTKSKGKKNKSQKADAEEINRKPIDRSRRKYCDVTEVAKEKIVGGLNHDIEVTILAMPGENKPKKSFSLSYR